MKRIRNIVFDFDGTLVDTAPLIIKTMHTAIRELGLPDRSDSECRSTIGLRLEEVPGALWSDGIVSGERFASTYRRIFDDLKRPLNVECFQGVPATLRNLHEKGFRMAIASSRSHRSLEEYISLFGLEDSFFMLVGGNDVVHGKPSPDPVLNILNTQGWNASETLTVGDAPVDILMGKGAGTMTCAVTYGNSSYEELDKARPDVIIDYFGALNEILI